MSSEWANDTQHLIHWINTINTTEEEDEKDSVETVPCYCISFLELTDSTCFPRECTLYMQKHVYVSCIRLWIGFVPSYKIQYTHTIRTYRLYSVANVASSCTKERSSPPPKKTHTVWRKWLICVRAFLPLCMCVFASMAFLFHSLNISKRTSRSLHTSLYLCLLLFVFSVNTLALFFK